MCHLGLEKVLKVGSFVSPAQPGICSGSSERAHEAASTSEPGGRPGLLPQTMHLGWVTLLELNFRLPSCLLTDQLLTEGLPSLRPHIGM